MSNIRDEFMPCWHRIREEKKDMLSIHDRKVLDDICSSSKEWIDTIPQGLLASYSYIYTVTQGLNTHEASIIERDVLRTIGAVKDGYGLFRTITEEGKSGYARSMRRVLTSISLTDGMGYCQGMNYAADFFLRVVPEKEAFCLFLHALRNKHLCCIYETNLPVLSDFMDIYEQLLNYNHPALAQSLKEKNFLAPFYSIEWFTTMFTLACPPQLTAAVWDLFFFGLKDAFVRCAIGIMKVLEDQLMVMNTEELLKNFRYIFEISHFIISP